MNDKKIGDMRPSQLITTFGPGAIMDLPDFSVIIAGLDDWNEDLCTQIDEPRLTSKLGLRKILSPPVLMDTGRNESETGTLPAYRFPKYMVCPNCRKLARSGQMNIDNKTGIAYCHCDEDTKTRVFPSRFIVACPHGHIDDFPWNAYVHAGKKGSTCKGKLVLEDKGSTGSIADVVVRCTECKGAERSLQDAFAENRTDVLGTCKGRRPWLGRDSEQKCQEPMRAMLRGASNIYFSLIASALRIPPFTNPVDKTVARYAKNLTKIDSLDKLKLALDMGTLSDLEEFVPEEVWEAIQRLHCLEEEGPELDLFTPEYEALLSGTQGNNNYDFEVEKQSVPSNWKQWISNLVMVRRLTEVRILDGFTRIDSPPDITSAISKDEETKETSVQASLSRETKNWRPGLVTRGEGIFITLDEDKLRDWENRKDVNRAGNEMAEAYRKYSVERGMPESEFPGVRYVLLHSLSHALMRQLCLDSGYSSTALRERIYSRAPKDDGKEGMAGILIYTATPDSEGSLGGLVELGKTKNFAEVLQATLHDSAFCSGDPLCSEHSPGTVGDLNGAACHACQLMAETSCERSNRFLDRNFLVPTISNDKTAFFV